MDYLILGLLALILLVVYFVFRKQIDKHHKIIFTVLSLILAVVFFLRTFAVSYNYMKDNGLDGNPDFFDSKAIQIFTGISLWFQIAITLILIMYPFFKFKVLGNYAKTFGLLTILLNIIFLRQINLSYTNTNEFTLFSVSYDIEVAIGLFYCIYILFSTNFYKFSKKELIELAVAIPVAIIFSMPTMFLSFYMPSKHAYEVVDLEFYHRLFIYASIAFIFIMYFLLKPFGKEYARMVLLYACLATMVAFCEHYVFKDFLKLSNWPLHLCNTAMFILPICLMFKLNKVFYFTLFINVLGAFCALLMPNYAEELGIFSTRIVGFYSNHIIAFAMPIIIILLGVYERPKFKEFAYSMLFFMIYFMAVLIINANEGTDFFFLNSDFIAEKLGEWAERLRDMKFEFTIGNKILVFYPLYQALFFLVYVVLGLGMWFVFLTIFQTQDFFKELKIKQKEQNDEKKNLLIKNEEKDINRCIDSSSLNKLCVRNISKSYGGNNFYSAKNVSFEVNEGEIFGFLGPNGAGKSTTIKCIVGIQPTTSGEIYVNGYNISAQPELTKSEIGFVPDHYALYENLTGREYLNYVADINNVSKAHRDERLSKYIDILDMSQSIDSEIRTYSHGMKQKIAIMSALVHNPKLWILDEPLTGLDPTSIFQVKECMREHARKGNIVFFSSHIIDVVEKMCDRIAIIKRGRIRSIVKMSELKEKGISLEDYFLSINENEDDEISFVEEKVPVKEEVYTCRFFKEKESLFSKLKKKIKEKKKNKEKKAKKND